MVQTLRPVRNMISFEVIPEETVSKGGIYLHGSARRQPYKVVRTLAVGPGQQNDRGEWIPPDIMVGDIAILSPEAGIDIEYDGVKVLMADAGEILAIAVRKQELQ